MSSKKAAVIGSAAVAAVIGAAALLAKSARDGALADHEEGDNQLPTADPYLLGLLRSMPETPSPDPA